MIRTAVLVFLLFVFLDIQAQKADSVFNDLETVEIKGLDLKMVVSQVPASIAIIKQRDINRFANTSLVPVFNLIPGVRMEERSPGSYRLSIRGSLLRSPFGVRNIKVYWKDMPLTDAGGNTYINLLDVNSIGTVEILKGPAGSIYGAGTGGVVSFSGLDMGDSSRNGGFAQFSTGSFNAKNGSVAWQWNGKNGHVQAFQSFSDADGYRRNSAMKRAVTQVSGIWKIGSKQNLEFLSIYSDLNYLTPGGLTLAQFNTDPRQARPATAQLPSAEGQKAGIVNKTLFSGITHSVRLSSAWQQMISFTLSHTNFDNPFITNYETRVESNFALRAKWIYEKEFIGYKWNYVIGAETIQGFHRIDSSGNLGGISVGTKARDNVRAEHSFLFTQAQLSFHDKIVLNGGLSINAYDYDLRRVQPVTYRLNPDFRLSILPRISALVNLSSSVILHTSLSRGYSSPTLSEVRPSAGGFYANLQAEKGWNLEAGGRGSFWRSKFRYDLTVFRFVLNDAIVRKVAGNGSEYFVNAGRIAQNGLELLIDGALYQRSSGLLRYWRITGSSSLSRFTFIRYSTAGIDYSGKKLTGVPATVVNTGVDVGFVGGLYMQGNFSYNSSLPLTDANDIWAESYRLLQARVGWKHNWGLGKPRTDLFFSGDNLLNERYSLGNDINAFGRRYYNPAPLANWMMGIKVMF